MNMSEEYFAVRNGDRLVFDLKIIKVNKVTAKAIFKKDVEKKVTINLRKMEIKGINEFCSFKVYSKNGTEGRIIFKKWEDKKRALKVRGHLERVIQAGEIQTLLKIGELLGI